MSDAATPISEPGLKGEVTIDEPGRAERAVARRSAESRATIPTVEYTVDVAAEALLEREGQTGCGVAAIVIAAAAHALHAVPRVNGAYRDGRYELYSRVNVGVTIVETGVYATPTIFDADRKPVLELGGELTDFYARAREDALHPPDLTGATFTVIDSSTFDVTTATPLVQSGQAATLAFGPIRGVPVVRNGQVVPGSTMQLHLAVDHRIVYGHHAASFLEEVKAFLEEADV
ncbi:MAG: 2-oxo acid dehydrogenase subunit E2 [Conexibacteraceae bacterium]|nr:2-oxo acid dehydrogenase subunit E2 [Conexibacteraceae bacterium]